MRAFKNSSVISKRNKTAMLSPALQQAFKAAALPLHLPLTLWTRQNSPREDVPIGICRHPVIFVRVEGILYALKELPDGLAGQEFELLQALQALQVSAVLPIGFLHFSERNSSLLITRYLEHAVPYRLLFIRPDLDVYREHLLDAVASLLVELHLNGIFWGDCSLSNTLFKQDAGYLQAYLVDAETSEIHASLSDNLRAYELDLMEENISGALADLAAEGQLPSDYPIFEVGASIRERYDKIWKEIYRTVHVSADEKYKIQERVRKLNALGFSVEHVLITSQEQDRLTFQIHVADRHYHRNQLQRFIGLEAEEQQALLMLNEIQEMRTELSRKDNRSVPLHTAAQHWYNTIYLPVQAEIAERSTLQDTMQKAVVERSPVELYCLMLEHKWYLSESARQDVGHRQALLDYVETVLKVSEYIND